MYAAHEISKTVRTRREEIGLSQKALAALSGLSRSTIHQIEAGSIKDLSLTRTAAVLEAIGLQLSITPAHPRLKPAAPPSPPLELAARTASVSYAQSLPPPVLADALIAGELPQGFEPHVGTLLEEAPVALLAKTVEQLHLETMVPREVIWAHMRQLATALKVTRELWRA